MRYKINNHTDLTMMQIGKLLDDINSEIDTCYIGKTDVYYFKFGRKAYKMQTKIMKSFLRVVIVYDRQHQRYD